MPACFRRSVSQFRTSRAVYTLVAITAFFAPGLKAQQPGSGKIIYSEAQAVRGQRLYAGRCAVCHGATLEGSQAPPLTGNPFLSVWAGQPLLEVANKIRYTMPPDESGKITLPQATDLVAYLLKTAKLPAGSVELAADEKALAAASVPGKAGVSTAAGKGPSLPPNGNLAQMMRGILFPSSNMIFNVQTRDPGVPSPKAAPGNDSTQGISWVDWGAGIYKGWEIVDYAAIAVADSAPLMLTPGRRCENGRLVPVNRPDWIKFTLEMAEAGRAAYKASQLRNQEAVSDSSNQLADSCLHCHEVYRDKPGRSLTDPSNKAARCQP